MMRAPAACGLLVLLCALLPRPACAGVELGVAWVDSIDGQASQALTVGYLTSGTHPWELMAGRIFPRSGASGPMTPSVNFVALGKRFTWHGWFVQGGVAYTDSDTEVLSRNLQFMTVAGYRWNRVSLSLRHLSNANTGGRNRGENLLVLQYGFPARP